MNISRTIIIAIACGLMTGCMFGCASAPKAKGSQKRTHSAVSMARALAIVAAFERDLSRASAKDIADLGAEAALKSDRTDAFTLAYKKLKSLDARDESTDLEALALRAQLLLAWGEAELTLAEILTRTAAELEASVRSFELREKLSEKRSAYVREERRRIDSYREVDDALRIIAADRIERGFRDAEVVITRAPEDYRGYRTAADAARLRNQWRRFDELTKKIELENKESNGLRFLRAAAAWQRDGDADAAEALFREALENDREFVRAQAQLVLLATSVRKRHEALTTLRKMAPDHQVVRFAGPGIDEAFAALEHRIGSDAREHTSP